MTHALFATMGGFMFSHDEQLRHPLNPLVIDRLIKYDYIDIRITEKEINDKSKCDGLSKALVILQTTWFAIQCIARGVQRLPITELELVTLVFVTLNLATYVLWWNKPLNAQCAVPVVLKRTISDRDWNMMEHLFGSQRPPAVNDRPRMVEERGRGRRVARNDLDKQHGSNRENCWYYSRRKEG
jgi:hypothetical protein